MKKEKNSSSSMSSGGPQKTGLSISVVNVKNNSDVSGGDTPATPGGKAGDTETTGNNVMNGENNTTTGCDNSKPATPQSGGGGETGGVRDSSTPGGGQDDKAAATNNNNNCNSTNVVKTETDSFLDTFDTKEGGESHFVI